MKVFRIVHVSGADFGLLHPEGTLLMTSARVRSLSNKAFDLGADEVRHEYNPDQLPPEASL